MASYYYHIIPLVKIPQTRSPWFTYASTEKLPAGSLVQISFGTSREKGIVVRPTTRPRFFTKPIESVLAPGVLTELQLSLATRIADHYFTALGVVLKFFVPPVMRRRKLIDTPVHRPFKCAVTLTAAQSRAIKTINRIKRPTQWLLSGPAGSGKTEVIFSLIRTMIESDKQTLVLIPEVFLSLQEFTRYHRRFSVLMAPEQQATGVVHIHSGLTASQYASRYQAIKDGTARVIIATRSGLLLPFQRLGLVVVDEEQDASFRQWDQSPRYDGRVVAGWLADLHQAQCVYVSATPSSESWFRIRPARHIQLPPFAQGSITVRPPSLEVVSLWPTYFRFRHQPVLISPELQAAIRATLHRHKQVLLLVSRRGKSRWVMCASCRHPLVCPNCESRLAHIGETYRCLHCSHTQERLSHCPRCGSLQLKDVGAGTEQVERVIHQLFPQARSLVIDQESLRRPSEKKRLFQQIVQQEREIIIGTTAIGKGFDWPQVGLVGVVNADDWSGKGQYLFHERHLAMLMQLAGRLNRPGSDQQGRCIIQTFRPEDWRWKWLQQWDWDSFVRSEIEQRKPLGFPPHKTLVQLTYRDASEKKVDKQTQTVYDKLLPIIEQEGGSLSAPFEGYQRKLRGKWMRHVLMAFTPPMSPSLQSAIKRFAHDWIVEIDPDHIF